MKFYIIIAGLVVTIAATISYYYDHLMLRRTIRRKREERLAQLALLPLVKADFSTPEGAVLCFENARQQGNLEAAAACRDFDAEAKLWLQERSHLSQEKKTAMLPETARAMEKSFRDGLTTGMEINWSKTKTYCQAREPFGDVGIVVKKTTVMPDGRLLSQRILVTETNRGWRIVKPLPDLPSDAA